MVANRNALKAYAPQARKDFIQAMTNRAAQFGITRAGKAPGEERGELFIISGKAFPKSVAEQRRRLISRIEATSFDQTMEAVAYTWFNRFLAIRYMELHGYFDHGYRVLSHPAGETEPEILQQAQHLTLQGLDRDMVVDLKLQGNQDEALYRRILIAQCNELHRAIPFLFERIDDETELLLPENLLQSDSIVRKLVGQIAESEWDEIEIIGWLYQFYISEKKDEVIGKVVKSEDIPAATQLFTPNWIVKYLVQNSLGAQWLATYPDSPLRAAMAYYIEPAEQTPEVQAQLDAITSKALDPEAITLIDPAVGSGHILVEAYDLFRAIYIERGYTPQAAARAILTKNLYGLDIDDRAAQMAGFALLMKARADDRTLLSDPPALNVMSLTDSSGWDAAAMADVLVPTGRVELLPPTNLLPDAFAQPTLSVSAEERGARSAIAGIVALFNGAKTFGSLISVPEAVMASLPDLAMLLAGPLSGDLLRREAQVEARGRLAVLVAQAKVLGRRYDCVVANPPYMGGKGMNQRVKSFVGSQYSSAKSDLYSAFICRGFSLCLDACYVAMVTMESWMFLASFEEMRGYIFQNKYLKSLLHMPYLGKGGTSMGINFGTSATIFRNYPIRDALGSFSCVRYFETDDEGVPHTFPVKNERECTASGADFELIPGAPIAYYVSNRIRGLFKSDYIPVGEICTMREGINTGDNEKFIRRWFEISIIDCSLLEDRDCEAKWFAHRKGGEFRKWYGNNEYVLNWHSEGEEIHRFHGLPKSFNGAPMRGKSYFWKECLSWSRISSGNFSLRSYRAGQSYDSTAPSIYDYGKYKALICSFLNGKIARYILGSISPTLDFRITTLGKLPIVGANDAVLQDHINCNFKELVDIASSDWDRFECSWNFSQSPLMGRGLECKHLSQAVEVARVTAKKATERTLLLEEMNNRLFIDAYGLADELTSDVPLNEITLTCNPHYRYGGSLTDAEREARLLADTMRELVSYSVGLMMGRYSLAEPGLIYAHAGNKSFDPGRYGSFAADDDGIVPITEEPWFADDAASRIEQFLAIAWPQAPINETLDTLTDALTQRKGGEPRAALRAYLAKTFYKDHLQTYRNRPIYWLFSSGKHKAFECLVYLHRYNESTLARMRTAYVTPLMGKMQQRISDLDTDIAGSASSAEKTRKARDLDRTVKQLAELRAFDEELRHLADQRISLDLDDGVKVNYGRFGTLLAAKDKVCGKDSDKDD